MKGGEGCKHKKKLRKSMCFSTNNTFLDMHLKHSFVKCTREQRKCFPHCPLSHFNKNLSKKERITKFSAASETGGSPSSVSFRVTTVHAGKKGSLQVSVGHQPGELRGMSECICPAVQTEVGIIALL